MKLSRHTGKAGLWTHGLDAWNLDAWILGLWTLGCFDSGQLNTWTLGNWTLWLWKLWLRTLEPKNLYPFLLTSTSFLSVSNALSLMYYGSVQIAMNSCYNSNLLQLIKSPFREKAMFKVKRFIRIKLTLESLKQVIYFFPK